MKRTAAILLAFLTMAGSAQAVTVSMKVGPLLKEARILANAGNYQGALAKLNEADTVKAYPDDTTIINSRRQAIRTASSPSSQAPVMQDQCRPKAGTHLCM